jgi:hypothetical protein
MVPNEKIAIKRTITEFEIIKITRSGIEKTFVM